MSISINTLNQGKIEGGFFGPITSQFDMGKYKVIREYFCHLLEEISQSTKPFQEEFSLPTINTEESYSIPDQISVPFSKDGKQIQVDVHTTLSSSEKLEALQKGNMISVKLTPEQISLGEYEIERKDFLAFTNYILQGGFHGDIALNLTGEQFFNITAEQFSELMEKNRREPTFVTKTREILKQARNDFLKPISQ